MNPVLAVAGVIEMVDPACHPPVDGVFHGYDDLDNERIDLDFCWVSLEELKKGAKVYPLELIPYIIEPRKEMVHFVSKQI